MHSPYRSRLIGCTILLFVFTSLVGASSASADVPGPITTRVLAILDGAGSGTTGMYLKEVGGPVIAAHAEDFQFAPASRSRCCSICTPTIRCSAATPRTPTR